MALGAIRIQDLHRWRPLRAEAFEGFWLLFDVDLDRNEISADEALNTRVGVHLGIQPSASPSHRSCIEIYQYRVLAALRFAKRNIDIVLPSNGHKVLLFKWIRLPGLPPAQESGCV